MLSPCSTHSGAPEGGRPCCLAPGLHLRGQGPGSSLGPEGRRPRRSFPVTVVQGLRLSRWHFIDAFITLYFKSVSTPFRGQEPAGSRGGARRGPASSQRALRRPRGDVSPGPRQKGWDSGHSQACRSPLSCPGGQEGAGGLLSAGRLLPPAQLAPDALQRHPAHEEGDGEVASVPVPAG